MYLHEHNSDVRSVKGVGPAIAKKLNRLGICTISELVLHLPRGYQDRRHIEPLSLACKRDGDVINAVVRVIGLDEVGHGFRKTLKVYVEDDSARAVLVCFGRDYYRKLLVPGRTFYISGSFRYHYGEMQSTVFEIEQYSQETEKFGKILPVYPLTDGLTQNLLRKIVANTISILNGKVEDELPPWIRKSHSFESKFEALRGIHFPENWEKLEQARRLLVFEELFHYQLSLLRKKRKRKVAVKQRKPVDFYLKRRLLQRLPFRLTDDQMRALVDIEQDLFAPYPMARLLQGDVGCGKTLVALLVALTVVESGEQVAFMAPTELLARQHLLNATKLLEAVDVELGFLSSGVSENERAQLLPSLLTGEVDILIGTHALFSKDVSFKKLGLVIVDEQHRFGVLQRSALVAKGDNPDLLLMTATPIPRTLALTAFGDLENTVIHCMPLGRIPVKTHLTVEGNEEKVYSRIRKELDAGTQAYFIYPLIEENDDRNLKDAETMYRRLKETRFFDKKVALIHSRVPDEEQQCIMSRFTAGEIDILVATSVVEVGVHIPNATCIVVEHAERFGLSALHQLRGRVGRGNRQSYAFLIYSKNITEDGIKRLKVMMETTNGFRIAEEDLKIRGPGEFLGIKQSGALDFKIADLAKDQELLLAARKAAHEVIASDPDFSKPENSGLCKVHSRGPAHTNILLS